MTYLTVQDIARRLQVHPQTVKRWLREGALNGFRLGSGWRVSEEDLARFVEEQRGKAAA